MDVFICGVCHAEFHDIVEFMEHKKTLGTYSCSHCNALFHDEQDAHKHTKTEHIVEDILIQATEHVTIEPQAESQHSATDPAPKEAVETTIVPSTSPDDNVAEVAVGELGDLTFVPCSEGNITLLGNIQIVHSGEGTDPIVTLAPIDAKGLDGDLNIGQTVFTFQQEKSDPVIENGGPSSDCGSLLTNHVTTQDNDTSQPSSTKHVDANGVDNDVQQCESEGIFACLLCNSFALTKAAILKHLWDLHGHKIEQDVKQVEELIVRLEPLVNSSDSQPQARTGKDILKVLAADPENTESQGKTSVQLFVQPPLQPGTLTVQDSTNNKNLQPTAKRKRGRPRKTDAQKAQEKESESKRRADEEALPSTPVCDADGLYRCSRCKRAFRKERHILVHRCLGKGDYVDLSAKTNGETETNNELVGDAEEVEVDTDPTADFKVYIPSIRGGSRGRPRGCFRSRGRRRGQRTKRILPASENIDASEDPVQPAVVTENDVQVQEEPMSLMTTSLNERPAVDSTVEKDESAHVNDEPEEVAAGNALRTKLNWRDDPRHVPVFSNEEERVKFEDMLNSVDLSCVDHMYTQHQVAQEIDSKQLVKVTIRENVELLVYSCNVCKKVFKSLSHMRLHCLVHTDLKPFKCPQCIYKCNAKGSLYTHMRKHTGNYFKCPKCIFRSCNRSHLAEHEATHDKMRHSCKLCHNPYSTVKSLVNHIRRYHTSPAGKKYLESFMTRPNYEMAVLHLCHICNRKFKKKVDRDRHLFVHNVKDSACVLQCRLCDYAAARRSYLENHQRKHRLVYVCCICDKLFLSSVLLRKHLEEHVKENQVSSKDGDAQMMSVDLTVGLPDVQEVCNDSAVSVCTDVCKVSSDVSGPTNDDVPNSASISIETSYDDINELNNVEVSSSVSVNASNESAGRVGSISLTKSKNPIIANNDVPFTNGVTTSTAEQNHERVYQLPEVNSRESAKSNRGKLLLLRNVDKLFDASICKSWYLPEPDSCFGAAPYANIPGELANGQSDVEDVVKCVENAAFKNTAQLTEAGLDKTPQPNFNTFQNLEYRILNVELYTKIRETFGHAECETCGRLFHSHVTLEPHLLTHSQIKPFKCQKCAYSACTKDNLKRHLETVHEGRSFPCDHCEYLATSRTSLWLHKQRHLFKDLRCKICDLQLSNMRKLREHIITMHPGVNREHVKQMMGSTHRVMGRLGRRSYRCPYCDKVFHRSSTDLQKHMWIHEGLKPFKCPLCPHSCRSQNNLNVHMLRHTQDKPHLCEECGKAYKSKAALRCHLRLHDKGSLLKCDQCDFTCTQKVFLKRHLEVHGQVQKYTCQWCGYKSNNYGYLKVHYLRRHQDRYVTKPPSAAEDQDKSTSAPAPVEPAEPQQMFKCVTCECLFSDLVQVKEHLQEHHGLSISSELTEATIPSVECTSNEELLQTGEESESHNVQGEGNTCISEEIAFEAAPETQLQDVTVAPAEPYQLSEVSTSFATEIDAEKAASAVNIVQQIFQQGALDSQFNLHSVDGENFVTVNPETIIVQDGEREVVLKGTPDGQYVVQYVR